MKRVDMKLHKRFWSKINVGQPWECWEWSAVKTKGYGQFRLHKKMMYAHRVAWNLTNGSIPPSDGYHGTCVLHHCDNPACCNPAHLFLGTQLDNVIDRDTKGRQWDRRGEKHPRAKLTSLDVLCIKHWLRGGFSQKKIARAFGVGQPYISKIKLGKVWSHVK